MGEGARKLRRIRSIKEIGIYPSSNVTLTGSEFHIDGAATGKARVPSFVFTRGM